MSAERASAVGAGPRPADPHLRLRPEERLRVHEIFYSLQGESTRAGFPCVLVRLTGCQMRCSWCDSVYSFYEGSWKSRDEVISEVAAYRCRLVELTGGEPLLQPGARPLLAELCDRDFEVLLETGGGVDIGGVDPRVCRIVDIKCPDSGEAASNRWQNLDLLTGNDELKLVLASEGDYRWARDLVMGRSLHERCPVSFSPVWGKIQPAVLAGWILRDRLPVRLQLQLHKLLWGEETRGV